MARCPHPPSRWRHPPHVLSPASRRRCRRGRSLDLDPAKPFPPLQEPHRISRAPRREPQAVLCPHPCGGPLRDTRDPPKAPDCSYLHPGLRGSPGKPGSIPAQSGQQRAQSRRTASRVSTPSRPLWRARQSGQAQVLAGEGGMRGCNPNLLASHTLLSGPTSHWSFNTGPFPVLKTVAGCAWAWGGWEQTLHGDRTETLMARVSLQLQLSINRKKPNQNKTFLSPSSNLLSRDRGGLGPSPPLPYSLKISGDCFSLSAAACPLVPSQTELRWKSIRSQSTPFQVPPGLALTWKVPGEATASSSCEVCSCPQMWPPQLT